MTSKRLLFNPDAFHSILFLKIHTCVALGLVRVAKKIEKASVSIEECPFFLFSIVQIEFEGINFYPFY